MHNSKNNSKNSSRSASNTDDSRHSVFQTLALTLAALLAFAGNSVLCRLALAENAIDPATFTVVRLLSGIAVLCTLVAITQRNPPTLASDKRGMPGSWCAALMLFIYALTFSFAYVSLDTATGALVLFGAVQFTMIGAGLFAGTRLTALEWAGLATAFGGFVYLVLPGVPTTDVEPPAIAGLLLMASSGGAWGIYSLMGRGSKAPLADTAMNFLRTLPLTCIALIFAVNQGYWTCQGLALALLSGGATSGLGYAIWYRALQGLNATQASVVQLLVPVLAAIGGILFAGELLTSRVFVAALFVLGGILLVVIGQRPPNPAQSSTIQR
jgi:drug/metabolite transporter (DMT)-like permease